MCVSVCVCVSVYMRACVSVHVCAFACSHMHVCMHVCMHGRVCRHLRTYVIKKIFAALVDAFVWPPLMSLPPSVRPSSRPFERC